MPEILVTNTECIEDDNGVEIKLYGRDANRERHTITVTDWRPYFYVLEAEADRGLLGESGINEFDRDVDFTPYGEYHGKDVARVYVEKPGQIRDAKKEFSQTFEADVTPTNRFRIDTELKAWVRVPANVVSVEEVEAIEAPVKIDPDPRVCVFDIEVDDRGGFPEPGEKRITSIVAFDTYEREYVGFIDGAHREITEMFPEGRPEELDKVVIEPTEKRMLIKFGCWLAERDPDLLTAWNSDFDVPYLIERMKLVGASPARLSPEGQAYLDWRGNAKIVGRTVYDLLHAYKKNQWGELRSYKLDDVAKEELGESKISHEEGYFEMWAQKPAKLMNYNGRDVRLTAGINDEAAVIPFRDNLRKMIGVDFEDTRENFQFIEMMVRRKLRERGEVGPTKTKTASEDFEGGFVVDPYKGVARNVIGIDLASLYPYTMKMLNLSPEMKLGTVESAETRCGPAILLDGPHAGKHPGAVADEYIIAANGVVFSLDEDGLFRQIVDEALDLKMDFKRALRSAEPGSEEEADLEVKYQVSKTICNSIYGVCGWSKFFLYDRETAEAITLSGQVVLKGTKQYVDGENVAEVIYGDTDSNYMKFPANWSQVQCLETAEEMCDTLNYEVYPEIAERMGVNPEDCLWEIEIEMYAPRFFQWGRKKRYAYAATWKDNMDSFDESLDTPEITIKGSAAKRSDASRLTQETEKKLIKRILNDADNGELSDIVYRAATRLDPEDPDWETIGIPGGISKEFSEYKKPTAHVEAAQNSNAILGTEFGKASKPMRVYIMPTYFDEVEGEIDRLAYDDAEDLEPVLDRITIDASRMTDTLLSNPLEPILDSVGVNTEAAIQGQTQTGLGAFL